MATPSANISGTVDKPNISDVDPASAVRIG
jgi:hypothetical protein